MSTNPRSFSSEVKTLSAFMAQTLKPLGYKKRRNGFNRRFENGLVHQVSVFSVGAYSIDHGKFYIHAGCYIPEAELYLKNAADPKWVNDYHCTIRGCFPKTYLSISEVTENLDLVTPHLKEALQALECVNRYDQVIAGTMSGEPFAKEPLTFSKPQPVVKACILLARAESEKAAKTIQTYLTALKSEESLQNGHIDFVSEWAAEMRLPLSENS